MKTSIILQVILILPCVLAYDYDYHDDDPRYTFHYAVESPYTGDMKSQTETRTGDVVRGQYSFMEADGSLRTVSYVADDIHGFRAVVENTPLKLPTNPKPVTRPPVPHNPPRRPLETYEDHERYPEIADYETRVPRGRMKSPPGPNLPAPEPKKSLKPDIKPEKQSSHFPKSDEDWHAIPDMFDDDEENGEVIVPLYVPRRFI